jgi:YHS domain-containing protein
MTAARQQRKPLVSSRVLLGVVLAGGIFAPVALRAASDNQLAVNSSTGLAISGFDPVAYFTDGKAVFGQPEIELNLDGAVWRFSNEGNRGAFGGHPEVYAPRFGGYDPVAIGQGRSVPGHPLLWVVVGERVYFFCSEKSRAAFLADTGRLIDSAERKWPEVARTLGE